MNPQTGCPAAAERRTNMIPAHPTLVAFLAHDRHDVLLGEAERRRLVREARAARTPAADIRRIFTLCFWRVSRAKPRPSGSQVGDDRREAA
jgi:hypothetical protein